MNSPLLGLTSAVSTPANPSAGVAETESGAAGLFSEMLQQMTGSGSEMLPEADVALAEASSDSEQTAAAPADLLAALVANLTGADPEPDDIDDAGDAHPTADDELSPTDQETDAASVAALAIVPTIITPTPAAVATTETVEAAVLPATGKSLPTPWLLLNQQANADVPASGEGDISASTLAAPTEAWSQLFEVASQLGEFKAAAEASVPNSRPASAEPLLNISNLAGPLASTSPTARSIAPEAVAGIPVRSANFANLVGNEVLWQAKIGSNQAEIRLDPPDLGPIDVRISRSDNETHLHFMVSHQATRDQLEQALPRLRELFGQGGLQLGQVEVEQGRREQLAQQPRENNTSAGKRSSDMPVTEEVLIRRTTLMGLIDDYA